MPQAIQARQILRHTVSGLIKEARQKSIAGGLDVSQTLMLALLHPTSSTYGFMYLEEGWRIPRFTQAVQ